MSNAVATVPAHIAARIAARKAGTMAQSSVMSAVVTEGFSFPRISIRAGRYRLVEDGVETPVGINLDVVIVGANPRVSKVFYAKPFDGAAEGVRPDCFSNDGIKPDESIQNPVANGCANCPHNVLGSKVTPSGAKSKLCGDQRHLAVVPAADPSKVYGLTISVAAMKNMREYFKELQNFGAAPEEVVTELGFDETTSFPKVTFARKGFAPETAMAKLDAIANSDEVKEVVRLIPPKNRQAALPAAPQATAIAAPQPKPAVDDAYEEEATAPAAAAPAPAPKVKAAPVKDAGAVAAIVDNLFD